MTREVPCLQSNSMSQSQSIIVLSSSCTGDDIPSNDTTDPPASSMSNSLSTSSSSFLQSLPIICDILMLPELPDGGTEALSLSQKRLNPCGMDNVIWMHDFGQTAILMSLTSCHVMAAKNETQQVALPVQPMPSTFVIDSKEPTNAMDNPVPNLSVAFGFDIAIEQWSEFLKVATTIPSKTNEEGHQSSKSDSKHKDSCDSTGELFYHDLLRSSFHQSTASGSFVSDNPELVLKHLQMMTEKETQDLDRILKLLGVVGVVLLGLLWWSGREMFRASQTESFHDKRIQHAMQEREEKVHCEQNRSTLASPAVAPRSPRRVLNFVTPSLAPQQQEVSAKEPVGKFSAPSKPLQPAPKDESFCDTPATVPLPQGNAKDPFQVYGVSPVQKLDDSEHHYHDNSVDEHSEEEDDVPVLPEETQAQLEDENNQQDSDSDDESSPVLLLLTTSLSINRKHVADQVRIKTLLESNKLNQVELVDGADPSKKALRNALFQLSGLRAVYPQLFVSRGSKLRFVGELEKVQELHDEGFMNEKALFDSQNDDWQHLEDIISAVQCMDETFTNQENATSTSTEHEEKASRAFVSTVSLESQGTTCHEAISDGEDSVQSVDESTSTSIHEVCPSEAYSTTGPAVAVHDHEDDESFHSTDSMSTPNPPPLLPPAENNDTVSTQADNDSNDGGEDSIHSNDSALSARTPPDASSNASTPSHSSRSSRSLSPYAKMVKAWEDRRLGRGNGDKANRPKLQPLALQWNTGTDLFGANAQNDQDEFSVANAESTGGRTKLVPSPEPVPDSPRKLHGQEQGELDSPSAPPLLEMTCASSPGSQDGASFVEDYW